MTLRPFKLCYNGKDYSKPPKELYYIENHRGERLLGEIKIGDNHFFHKILSYPITAFGYRIQFEDTDFKEHPQRYINPRFDKKDVIRALDFWIEYWVYQNKCDYILEGTVNKDFELTVRELIEFRDAVMKMPTDSEFVRQKIRVNDVNFNYEWAGKYYILKNNKVDTNMTKKDISYHTSEFNVIFPKPLSQPAVDQIIEFTENVLNSSKTTASTVDQFCYVVRKKTYKEVSKELNDIPKNTSELFEMFGNSFSNALSEALGTLINRTLDVGENTITEEQRDDIFDAMNLSSLLASSTNEIHYPNMVLQVNGIVVDSNSNDFSTVPIRLVNGLGTIIDSSIFMNNMSPFNNLESFSQIDTHIRLDGANTRIILNGNEYHMVNLNILHNPRQRHNRIYRDLWVTEANVSIAANGNEIRLNFNSTEGVMRINISLTLNIMGNETGEFMRQNIGEDSRPWELEILGNNRVRIGDSICTVLEPINISIH